MFLPKEKRLLTLLRHPLFNCMTLLTAGAFFLSSCTNKHIKNKKYAIGFSQVQNDDDWRKTMMGEMEREVSFHDNIEFIVKDAEENSTQQIQQINELIKQVDLLIVSPNETEPLKPVIEKAYYAHIPVILIDRSVSSDKYAAFVGASNVEVGKNAGRYAVSLLKGKGKVLEIMGRSSASPFIDRHKGFVEIISANKGIQLLPIIEDHQKNYEKLLDSTIKYTNDIEVIFAQSDFIAKFVYQICKKNGKDKSIKIIGVDGLSVPGLGMDMVYTKMLTATVMYPTGGQEAIQTALNILEHKPYKKENPLDATIIDSSNVKILKQQSKKVLEQQIDIDNRQKKIEQQIAFSKNQTNIILAISITLAIALILGSVLFYLLNVNRKISNKLKIQKEEISTQRNKLIELVHQLKEANNAKFHFFTNISHELRTPLTLIMGPLEDIMASPKLHFTLKNNLDLIQRNSIRLLKLINQLMDFRKIEEGKMKLNVTQNNLSNFVFDITNSFKVLAKKKNISFNVHATSNDINIYFDVNMLDKVLFNLLSNAFKFTPENGTIQVTISTNEEKELAIIKVQDNGIGMSEEDANHAFEMFYQGHSSTFRGTGLGLSLSKELIELHKGEITVESKKDHGTCFSVIMPFTRANDSSTNGLDVNSANQITHSEEALTYITDILPFNYEKENNGNGKQTSTILIIEDNDDLRAFLKNKLSDRYEVYAANNGIDGINTAFDIIPDLIISDIILPGQNGIKISETLKNDLRTSHIPIVLLTAKGSIQDQIEGIKSQADIFIVKPFNLSYLEETIKTLLKNRLILRDHYTSELPMESRSNASNKIDRKFISEFSAIIENNISNEDLSVEDICKEIGISRVQLYRKVKALIGMNVNDYILSVRLKRAKYLLLHEDLSISEISYKVGFSSQAYFSTVFKFRFGVTPSEFKENKP